jgi:tubulin polyglutamylase TTLL1
LEYSLFAEEFNKDQTLKWIFKPSNQSQGKGIQIITKLQQVKQLQQSLCQTTSQFKQQIYVISRYVENPFLIFKKKFDLRTYVLVTSFRPLKVWRYNEGFARVCFENYKSDNSQDLYSHLTNVSFQKYSSKYNEIHGGKWPLKSLLFFLERVYGK